MILKSFAKINLSLKVKKKLSSGLHDIDSYFCQVNIFDRIIIKKIKDQKDILEFKGKFAKFINKKKNSVSDALKILRKQNIISGHYSVKIYKKIPIFAGLGGGTSNAAYLTKHFLKKKISKKILSILEKKIGSDLKLFFYKQGHITNINVINSFRKKYNLFFLLVYPNIKSSTKTVYSKVRKYSKNSKYRFKGTRSKKKFIQLLINSNNDLQSIVEKKYSLIRKLLVEIQHKKGCYYSRMTGSGSACYGVFVSEKTAKAALNLIKLKYPKFWFSIAKTI